MNTGPTKRAGSMDDIMTMESDLIRLQGENARLRTTIEAMRKNGENEKLRATIETMRKIKPMESLRPYVEAYLSARETSAKAVRDNDHESKNHESTGTGHQTPFHVLDSVRAWQKSAMNLAEKVAEELRK